MDILLSQTNEICIMVTKGTRFRAECPCCAKLTSDIATTALGGKKKHWGCLSPNDSLPTVKCFTLAQLNKSLATMLSVSQINFPYVTGCKSDKMLTHKNLGIPEQ